MEEPSEETKKLVKLVISPSSSSLLLLTDWLLFIRRRRRSNWPVSKMKWRDWPLLSSTLPLLYTLKLSRIGEGRPRHQIHSQLRRRRRWWWCRNNELRQICSLTGGGDKQQLIDAGNAETRKKVPLISSIHTISLSLCSALSLCSLLRAHLHFFILLHLLTHSHLPTITATQQTNSTK